MDLSETEDYTRALEEAKDALKLLDSLADEDWIAEGFVPELLIYSSEDGAKVNYGLISYELLEMGLGSLAEEFASALSKLSEPAHTAE